MIVLVLWYITGLCPPCQVPFPPCLSSVQKLVQAFISSPLLTSEERRCYHRQLSDWASVFSVTSQQKLDSDTFFKLTETKLTELILWLVTPTWHISHADFLFSPNFSIQCNQYEMFVKKFLLYLLEQWIVVPMTNCHYSAKCLNLKKLFFHVFINFLCNQKSTLWKQNKN